MSNSTVYFGNSIRAYPNSNTVNGTRVIGTSTQGIFGQSTPPRVLPWSSNKVKPNWYNTKVLWDCAGDGSKWVSYDRQFELWIDENHMWNLTMGGYLISQNYVLDCIRFKHGIELNVDVMDY